jgi:hypothetical protein
MPLRERLRGRNGSRQLDNLSAKLSSAAAPGHSQPHGTKAITEGPTILDFDFDFRLSK